MRRVLVLEANGETAKRLLDVLRASGVDAVSLVSSMREACLTLAQQPHDLAIVPLANAKHQVHTFRSLQSGLPIVVTTTRIVVQMADDAENLFQGIVRISRLESELPAALEKVWSSGRREVKHPELPEFQGAELTREMLQFACQEVNLGDQVKLAVFSRGSQPVAHGGRLDEAWARVITARINRTWDEQPRTAQIQFLQTADFVEPVMLYTRPVAGYLLTLAAGMTSSIKEVRKEAEKLLAQLDGGSFVRPTAETTWSETAFEKGVGGTGYHERSFAIVWQPVDRLPVALQSFVRRAIQRLAQNNGCILSFISIETYFVHIVVTCPPGRSSVWAAKLFKDGVQQEIQGYFGVPANLWMRGFYAAESRQPLSEVELDLFLNRG